MNNNSNHVCRHCLKPIRLYIKDTTRTAPYYYYHIMNTISQYWRWPAFKRIHSCQWSMDKMKFLIIKILHCLSFHTLPPSKTNFLWLILVYVACCKCVNCKKQSCSTTYEYCYHKRKQSLFHTKLRICTVL